ncbi:MAG: response regulator transcription factor [Clostridia bacterium]|jgi:two-component system response regulator VicR|nr:response regulator transcription factor [Clostridiaceae bacterium]
MNRTAILFVEDDPVISTGLTYSLKEEGYTVYTCENYKSALSVINDKPFDLAILDVSLPDGNGYDLCKRIKEKHEIPVIFLTASDDEVNVVMGLDMGADDYVSKPFRLRELLSRIKSVLRRYKAESGAPSVISLGNVTVHTGQGKVYKNGEEILLTAMEYRLLLILASRPGQIMTRGKLLEDMWDIAGDYVNDNTLTVYIKRLREKIEDDPKNPTVIKTVRGIGYMTEK